MENTSSTKEIVLNYYETKNMWYLSVFILIICIISTIGVQTYLSWLPLIMFIVIFLYPSATISLSPDYFYYKKGKKVISVKWNEVVAIHQDPIVALNPISYYLSKKFSMGGFFIETSQGFTNYIGAVGNNKYSLNALKRAELIRETMKRSGAILKSGEVSVTKMPAKLIGISIVLLLILLVGLGGLWLSHLQDKEFDKLLIR